MRDAAIFVLVVLALLVTGCPVTQPQNTPVPEKLFTDPGTGGGYFLYVSTAYNRNRPAPLIVSCHGTVPFDPAESQVRELKMLAEQHGAILICPKLTSSDGILGSGSINSLLHDERLIMSMISHMHYLYNIDRHNILITGFSGGGFPAYFVGLRHPDVFSCLVARNCNFNRHALEDWYPPEALETPIKVYWGEHDQAPIKSQSRDAIDYLRSAGFQVETEEIPGAGHDRHPEIMMRFWLRHWHGTPPPSYLLQSVGR
jgi:predicted esterase